MNELTKLPIEIQQYLALKNDANSSVPVEVENLINSASRYQLNQWRELLMQLPMRPGNNLRETARTLPNEPVSFCNDVVGPVMLGASLGGLGGTVVGFFKGSALARATLGGISGACFGGARGAWNVMSNFSQASANFKQLVAAARENLFNSKIMKLQMMIKLRLEENTNKQENDIGLRRRIPSS